jgi:hypothetical protein
VELTDRTPDVTLAQRSTAPTAGRPHQMIRLATTASIAAASLATATAAAHVLAYAVPANHNETLVASGEPRHRWGKAATVVTAGVVAASASAMAGAPVLAVISFNHNETLVGSVG